MSCIPLQRTTQTSMPPAGFFVFFCSLYFNRTRFFVLISLHFDFAYNTKHKHPSPPQNSNPKPQQAIGCRPLALDSSATGVGITGIGRIRTRIHSRRAATDLRPRTRSHQNRLLGPHHYYRLTKCTSSFVMFMFTPSTLRPPSQTES
jgi:hypothetical protein